MSAPSSRARAAVPNGVFAVGLFIATEGALFGTLIASYFYLRFNSTRWPPAGIPRPDPTLPLVLAAALVLAAVPLVLAGRAARSGRRGRAAALVGAGTLVQAGYLAVQIVLYLNDLDDFSVTSGAYGSIYFTLLFADHAHVAAGLLLNGWVLARLAGGLSPYRVSAVRVVGWYACFVATVGVLVTLTQVSPS